MRKVLARARPFLFFGLSIALGKGMAFFSIPLVAHHLSPAEYGRLELVASIVEVAGLALSMGLADTLFRFTSGQGDAEQKCAARGLFGNALLLALIAGSALQLGLYVLAPLAGLSDVSTALAFGLGAAAISGLIELPLAWLRLKDRPGLFLLFNAARSLTQVFVMFLTLRSGNGILGILAGNAAVDAMLAAILVGVQFRQTGIGFDRLAFKRLWTYGLPLVGGAFSMFVLGACDRWFLAGNIPSADLGFYGLGSKLAMIVALVMSPFAMWWYPRRIGLLTSAAGLEKSARATAAGFLVLGAGALVANCGAPVFIGLLLPAPYAGALQWLPWLVLVSCLNEMCSLLNAGAYAQSNGLKVLGVNAIAAGCALAAYVLLVPKFGISGAIAATIAAQLVRMTLFIATSRALAPIAYRWDILVAALAVNAAALAAGRVYPGLIAQFIIAAAAMLVLAFLGWRMLGIPSAIKERAALA